MGGPSKIFEEIMAMASENFDWNETKQLSILQLILAFAIPSAVAYTGFRVVLPMLVESGTPTMIAWPVIASIMLLNPGLLNPGQRTINANIMRKLFAYLIKPWKFINL